MLADLLSPANYIMVNRDAIRILGLNAATYCSELLTIYKKVVNKKKFVNDQGYFEVDREYISKQTSLSIEDQIICDTNLSKVDIVELDPDNVNVIKFNIETFGSVLACEDIQILNNVSDKVVTKANKQTKEAKKNYMIQKLKEGIQCNNPKILFALRDWVDSIYEAGKGLSKIQITKFKNALDIYCKGDVNKALQIIDIAISSSYVNCQWAISAYERLDSSTSFRNNSKPLISQQNQVISTGVSQEEF